MNSKAIPEELYLFIEYSEPWMSFHHCSIPQRILHLVKNYLLQNLIKVATDKLSKV
jgi:hypothetical protein